MAEEATTDVKGTKRNTGLVTLVIVLVVAVVEGAAFFTLIKVFGGGPEASYGADGQHVLEGGIAQPAEKLVEVALLTGFKVPNSKTGRTFIYDFDISVAVPESRQQEVSAAVQRRDAEIRDRVFQIVRQASPRVLEEDDFGTLRLLIRHALGEVLGQDDVVQRVLIPRWLPIDTGG